MFVARRTQATCRRMCMRRSCSKATHHRLSTRLVGIRTAVTRVNDSGTHACVQTTRLSHATIVCLTSLCEPVRVCLRAKGESNMRKILTCVIATLSLGLTGLGTGAAFADDASDAWAAAVAQIMARDGISEEQASTNLANFLVWDVAVREIMVRDGVTYDKASRNLAAYLAALEGAKG